MNLTKFYTDDRFGLLIDLRSMADQALHGSGARLVNTKDGVQLELERNSSGASAVNCHVFVISDSQMNMMGQQLESLQYWYRTRTPASYRSTLSLSAWQTQANQGLWRTRSMALSAASSTTSCSSAWHSRTTRPTTELVKMIHECLW